MIWILYEKILGLLRKLNTYYANMWAYAYLKRKGASLPNKGKIHFYGKPSLVVVDGGRVSIGDEFVCRSGFMHAIDNSCGSRIFVGKEGILSIGKFSGISNTTIHCYKSVVIGDYVNIGGGCMIFDTNFHSTDWRKRMNREEDILDSKTSPVFIGDCVFIGARSIITKGVSIGTHSMIAAGSVVVNSVPPNELWGGGPCCIHKENRLNVCEI